MDTYSAITCTIRLGWLLISILVRIILSDLLLLTFFLLSVYAWLPYRKKLIDCTPLLAIGSVILARLMTILAIILIVCQYRCKVGP